MPDPLRGLHPHQYVLFGPEGERRELTFYAESRRDADKMALAWAKPKGKIMRRKREARKS